MKRLIMISAALCLLSAPALANTSLAGVVEPLAAKVREIQASCGSKILSTIDRRGGRSNHRLGRAVDLGGNPYCIYAHLKGWPGGYSTDYGSVLCRERGKTVRCPHVHVSYNPGGQEWGLHFAHRVPSGASGRSARRSVASASTYQSHASLSIQRDP